MTAATFIPPSLDAEAWLAIIATLAIVGAVIEARRAVEATHGTPDEPTAIDALGDQLTRLEDAYGGLRTIHDRSLKDA